MPPAVMKDLDGRHHGYPDSTYFAPLQVAMSVWWLR